MSSITVHLTEEQREWVDRASLEIEDSRSEVIRRLIDAHRTAGSGFEDGGLDTAPADLNGDEPAADGQSRDELLERIERLEESLESQEEAANGAADEEQLDDSMGWR